MNTEVQVRKRRSVRLTNEEHKSLKAYRRKFQTEVECAEAIGISREVLNRTLILGSASQETIEKIRTKIQ